MTLFIYKLFLHKITDLISGWDGGPGAGLNRILTGLPFDGSRVGAGGISATLGHRAVPVHIRDDDLVPDSVLARG